MPVAVNDKRSVGAGFVAGLAAFLVGYLLTFLWRGRAIERSIEPLEALLSLFEAEPIGAWRVVGWLYYGGHFVDTRVTAEFGPFETAVYLDLVREGAGTLETLYLVPPVLLLIAGAIVAAGLHATDLPTGAILGASIVVGYLIAVLAGLVVFAHEGTRPDPLPAIVIAGVLYPVLFGAVGGSLGTVIAASVWEDRR